MSRVAGIAQTDAQKSSDMYGKCRYMDEITGGRGITFATGTPISNSMVELYTMMRYLQFDTLERNGHRHFDSWAADFGEKVTAMELKPEGTGFRSKTRFAKFYNLPELISIWKEAADIQTTTSRRSWPPPGCPWSRSPSSTTLPPTSRRRSCSPKSAPARCAFSSAAPRRWALGRIFRTGS